jgi:transposase
MDRIAVFVGLDYHQDSVQVCVMDGCGRVLANRSCANEWGEVAAVAERCGRVVRAGIEACTGAASLAEELSEQAGWSVDQAHPGYVSRMKQNPDKTDYTDAQMLADLVRVGYLPRVWTAPREVRDLRVLVRYRHQLAKARRNSKLRICAILREQRAGHGPGRRWTRVWLEWLGQEASLSEQSRWVVEEHLAELEGLEIRLRRVEDRLEELTRDDPIVRRLVLDKGVGLVTAWTIRAMVGRFDRFRTGKQLSRFCGLTPCNASSGKRQADAGLIRAGDPELRAVIIEAAHRFMRYNGRWQALAAKMRAEGKKTSVIAAAVANRWMRWLFHQMQPARLAA